MSQRDVFPLVIDPALGRYLSDFYVDPTAVVDVADALELPSESFATPIVFCSEDVFLGSDSALRGTEVAVMTYSRDLGKYGNYPSSRRTSYPFILMNVPRMIANAHLSQGFDRIPFAGLRDTYQYYDHGLTNTYFWGCIAHELRHLKQLFENGEDIFTERRAMRVDRLAKIFHTAGTLALGMSIYDVVVNGLDIRTAALCALSGGLYVAGEATNSDRILAEGVAIEHEAEAAEFLGSTVAQSNLIIKLK